MFDVDHRGAEDAQVVNEVVLHSLASNLVTGAGFTRCHGCRMRCPIYEIERRCHDFEVSGRRAGSRLIAWILTMD